MSSFDLLRILLGGAVFGAGALLLKRACGRVAGFSGIVAGVLEPGTRRDPWRWWLLSGVALAAALGLLLDPTAVSSASSRPWPIVGLAGLLVGYGTRLGNGCTSGHGICGVSRGSPRSLASTAIFCGVAFVTFQLAAIVEAAR